MRRRGPADAFHLAFDFDAGKRVDGNPDAQAGTDVPEFGFLIIGRDPDVLIVEHGKNRLAGRITSRAKHPSPRDDAGKGRDNDRIGKLRIDNCKVGLGRGDLRLVPVNLRLGKLAGAFRVVVLLLRNDLGLELFVDARVIVQGLCLVYRRYFNASGQKTQGRFGFLELRPQIGIVEPHERIALYHRSPSSPLSMTMRPGTFEAMVDRYASI